MAVQAREVIPVAFLFESNRYADGPCQAAFRPIPLHCFERSFRKTFSGKEHCTGVLKITTLGKRPIAQYKDRGDGWRNLMVLDRTLDQVTDASYPNDPTSWQAPGVVTAMLHNVCLCREKTTPPVEHRGDFRCWKLTAYGLALMLWYRQAVMDFHTPRHLWSRSQRPFRS
jgi:hypothetical protein